MAEVIPLRRDPVAAESEPEPEPEPPRDPIADEVGMLLGAPDGASVPEFPAVTPLRRVGIRDMQLADVLHDAIDHLEINWE